MLAVVAMVLVGAAGAWAQKAGKDSKPPVSFEMVSDERMVIYKLVVATYRGDASQTLHVGEKTSVLDLSVPLLQGCAQGLMLRGVDDAATTVHKFTDAEALGPEVKLVKGEKPGSMKMRKPTFRLSEIVFDEGHAHAIVSYSSDCGQGCGNGKTVILENVEGNWKIASICANWAG
jgi:hypothetical protein